MKHIISTVILTPVAVSIISGGLMILSNIVQNNQMTWAIWGVTLVSTLCAFLIISGLCSFWFAQWLAWRVTKQLHKKNKKKGDLSQYKQLA